MISNFFDLLQRSLVERGDVVFNGVQFGSEETALDRFSSAGLIKKLDAEDIDGRVFHYPSAGSHIEMSFERREGLWWCEPIDLVGDVITLPLNEVNIFQLHYNEVFKIFCKNSGFSYEGRSISTSEDIFLVGTKEVSGKRIGWFHIASKPSDYRELLSYLRDFSLILISGISSQESCFYNDRCVHVELPSNTSLWKLDALSFASRANGFLPADLFKETMKPLILDSVAQQIYLYGKNLGDSVRSYNYIDILYSRTGERGLNVTEFAGLLSTANDKTVVSNDRRELKERIEAIFGKNDSLFEKCLQGLGLQVMKKGELYKLGFSKDDVVIF